MAQALGVEAHLLAKAKGFALFVYLGRLMIQPLDHLSDQEPELPCVEQEGLEWGSDWA